MDYETRLEIETRLNRDIRKNLNDLESSRSKLDGLRQTYDDSIVTMIEAVQLTRSDDYWFDWESELQEFKVKLKALKDDLQDLYDAVHTGHHWAKVEYQALKRRNENIW